jgi:hypothetical protein
MVNRTHLQLYAMAFLTLAAVEFILHRHVVNEQVFYSFDLVFTHPIMKIKLGLANQNAV